MTEVSHFQLQLSRFGLTDASGNSLEFGAVIGAVIGIVVFLVVRNQRQSPSPGVRADEKSEGG